MTKGDNKRWEDTQRGTQRESDRDRDSETEDKRKVGKLSQICTSRRGKDREVGGRETGENLSRAYRRANVHYYAHKHIRTATTQTHMQACACC